MRRLDPSFDRFVIEASPSLLRTAHRLTGDVHLAEDLLQAALWRVARHWARASDNPVAYGRRTLINLATDGWRSRSRRVVEVPGVVPELPAAEPSSDGALLTALNALAPRQRAVVVLRYWEDLSVEETASLLGCTAGTVKSTASKALAHLRTHLETQGARP